MIIEKTCAFTGHREIEEDFNYAKLQALIEEYICNGFITFLCGMAVGFDLIAAEAVINLKQKYPPVKLIACIPCNEQSRYFTAEEKFRYENILKNCNEVKVLSKRYYNGCMQARDRFMVDNCSILIAYKRKNTGGTYYTVKYALSQNKRIRLI